MTIEQRTNIRTIDAVHHSLAFSSVKDLEDPEMAALFGWIRIVMLRTSPYTSQLILLKVPTHRRMLLRALGPSLGLST